jgi:ribosomal protein S18 acetylase RimI-like enzyme
MAPQITIRKARAPDLPGMALLERRCFTLYRITSRQLARLRTSPTAISLVAAIHSHVIGDAIALIRRTRRGPMARIYTLAVDPEWRGRGVASRLLSRLLRELKSRGVQRIRLEVQASNRRALKLYRNAGFNAIEILHDYYGADRDGVRMLHEG